MKVVVVAAVVSFACVVAPSALAQAPATPSSTPSAASASSENAPPPAPPPPSSPPEKRAGWNVDAEVFGARATSLAVSGGDHDAHTYGVGFASIGLANGQSDFFTYRGESLSHIGGGAGGFEGELGGSLTLGVGFLADGTHGPFARIGFEGRLLGNDSVYESAIRFPRGEIGWHIGSPDGLVLEIGGAAAPTLDGRFNVGDAARRRLGSSGGYGAYADLLVGPLSGTLQWTRFAAVSMPGTPVDELAGHVCLATGRAKKEYGFGLCLDGRATSGDVGFGDPFRTASAQATYLGLTLGLGTTVSK